MTISFFHSGDANWASYRYRAARPASVLGATLNYPDADVLIFSKPVPSDVEIAQRARTSGRAVIVDICDDHFDRPEYLQLLQLATRITCSAPLMAELIAHQHGHLATFIPDPYEFGECTPHATDAARLLWFGHPVNRGSILRVAPQLVAAGYQLRILSNFPGAEVWSLSALAQALAWADIVVLPATTPYKSCNRTVEAIRAGCAVVAEPHPSLEHPALAGLYIGNILEGVRWTQTHSYEANQTTARLQRQILQPFSLQTVAAAWKTICEAAWASRSGAAIDTGEAGSTSTSPSA